MRELFKSQLDEHRKLMDQLEVACFAELERIGKKVVSCLNDGKKILFCGNGGSAADAQHLAAEFVVRFRLNRKALSALALTTDTSVLTATGNDFSFEEIFSRQVAALGQKGDCLIAISTSGTSPNVLKAAEVAKELGLTLISITGKNDTALTVLADNKIQIPYDDTARIQEAYLFMGHILCDYVEKMVVSTSDRS